MSESTYKLKGNESFNIREGWLCKGINAIREDATIFTQPTAMDTLGVGSKMVKSIRFWMQASGLTEEVRGAGKRQQILTPDFGKIIVENDPYFEDITTLWLIHSKIVSRSDICTAWYIFFNLINTVEFDRDDIIYLMTNNMDMLAGTGRYSEKSLSDDVSSIIKMYAKEDTRMKDPEENIGSPFAELGLIQKSESSKGKYRKMQPILDSLDKYVVMYIILGAMEEGQNAISVDDLLNKPRSVGKTLNMGRSLLYDYLDKLRNAKCITLNRTAGLDMVYAPGDLKQVDILKDYYQ